MGSVLRVRMLLFFRRVYRNLTLEYFGNTAWETGWIKNELVCIIEYTEWTRADTLSLFVIKKNCRRGKGIRYLSCTYRNYCLEDWSMLFPEQERERQTLFFGNWLFKHRLQYNKCWRSGGSTKNIFLKKKVKKKGKGKEEKEKKQNWCW